MSRTLSSRSAQHAIARIVSGRLPIQDLFEGGPWPLAEVLEATLIEHIERLGDEVVAALLAEGADHHGR